MRGGSSILLGRLFVLRKLCVSEEQQRKRSSIAAGIILSGQLRLLKQDRGGMGRVLLERFLVSMMELF